MTILAFIHHSRFQKTVVDVVLYVLYVSLPSRDRIPDRSSWFSANRERILGKDLCNFHGLTSQSVELRTRPEMIKTRILRDSHVLLKLFYRLFTETVRLVT